MSAGHDAVHPLPPPGSPRREQFAGCLIGQAIADGLGAPFEGLFDDHVVRITPSDSMVFGPQADVLR
ncbi:MAG: ADP-ribosylglycohydrolase family protein, partial [Thermoleophilia bacterium]|nr:ADP-ribosylglycohydrolase family protein [Thermoleophilia bacterium]